MSQAKPPSYDQPQTEDALPKVIICGVTENNMPKIIVCDGKKKKKPKLTLPSQQIQTGGKVSLLEAEVSFLYVVSRLDVLSVSRVMFNIL